MTTETACANSVYPRYPGYREVFGPKNQLPGNRPKKTIGKSAAEEKKKDRGVGQEKENLHSVTRAHFTFFD